MIRKNKEGEMNGAEALNLAQETLVVLLKVSAPVTLIGLFVGLIVSFFQALTQIQEMTLTFVPKIIAIFIGLIVFMPYMAETLQIFVENQLIPLLVRAF